MLFLPNPNFPPCAIFAVAVYFSDGTHHLELLWYNPHMTFRLSKFRTRLPGTPRLPKLPKVPRLRTSEFDIQVYVAAKLRSIGILFHGDTLGMLGSQRLGGKAKMAGSRKGWPDLCLIGPWGVHYFELKASDGTVSPEQNDVHRAIRSHGVPCDVIVASSGPDALYRIQTALGLKWEGV